MPIIPERRRENGTIFAALLRSSKLLNSPSLSTNRDLHVLTGHLNPRVDDRDCTATGFHH